MDGGGAGGRGAPATGGMEAGGAEAEAGAEVPELVPQQEECAWEGAESGDGTLRWHLREAAEQTASFDFDDAARQLWLAVAMCAGFLILAAVLPPIPAAGAEEAKKEKEKEREAPPTRSPRTTKILPAWVLWWLAVSAVICLWDASYVLLRPWSASQQLWVPYEAYARVDRRYGVDESDAFNKAQSLINIAEVFFGLIAVARARRIGRGDASAVALALFACAATCSKTVCYFIVEACGGLEYISHNTPQTALALFVLPSSIWIVVPALAFSAITSNISKELALTATDNAPTALPAAEPDANTRTDSKKTKKKASAGESKARKKKEAKARAPSTEEASAVTASTDA